MSYNPNNPDGQAAMAASAPVVTASDDSNLKGFAAASAGGYVRQDSNATIAKESGGNLASILANQTNGTQKTQFVDVSGNVASVLVPGTANSSGNGVLTAGTSETVTVNITSTTPVVYDVGNYSYFSLQVNGTYSGQTAFFVDCSNDNANWYSNPMTEVHTVGNTEITAPGTTTGIYVGPLLGRYLRIRPQGGYSSGSMSGAIVFKTAPTMARGTSVLAAQTGTWTVGLSAGSQQVGSISNTGFVAQQTDTIGSATTMTITLASLASSTSGVGRQSTLITGNTARSALIGVQVKMGTTPTANSLVYVYLIRSDTSITDDGAGASDAALTVVNAPLLGTLLCPSSTTGQVLTGLFDTKQLGSLGPTWGIAIVNATGAALDATAGSHAVHYTKLT